MLRISMSVGLFCVAAAAVAAVAGVFSVGAAHAGEAPSAPADITGRWQGASYEMSRSQTCDDDDCRQLTLDISRCGEGWCGIEVAKGGGCGGTALRINAGELEGAGTLYKGELKLAEGTEPYTVEGYFSPGGQPGQTLLEITGDTGGEFRVFRRSFPFHTALSRTGDALCRPEKSVSMLTR
jgi:uncharacterized low-complexity protein